MTVIPWTIDINRFGTKRTDSWEALRKLEQGCQRAAEGIVRLGVWGQCPRAGLDSSRVPVRRASVLSCAPGPSVGAPSCPLLASVLGSSLSRGSNTHLPLVSTLQPFLYLNLASLSLLVSLSHLPFSRSPWNLTSPWALSLAADRHAAPRSAFSCLTLQFPCLL